jgi:spermidine synthase
MFYGDNFTNFEYDRVLIAGLGFGFIPNELSQINKCSKIDVVEISQELIDYTTTSGHLPNDVNLIQGDIYTYTTTEKYDLIIIDTIWEDEDMSEAQVDLLTSKFLNTNLNKVGVLYIPLKRKWLVNN